MRDLFEKAGASLTTAVLQISDIILLGFFLVSKQTKVPIATQQNTSIIIL